MTRRKEARESGPIAAAVTKMAPPPLPASQKRGADRVLPGTAGLQRFARTGQKDKASSSGAVSAPASPQSAEAEAMSLIQSQAPSLCPAMSDTACSQEEDAVSPDTVSPEPTIRDIFSAVTSCNASLAALTQHMGDLKNDMGHVRQDLRKINERVKEAEERISRVEDQLPTLSQTVKTHTQQINSLLLKVDDLENRSRRSNLRLVGVPEKEEGRDPVAYFERWLLEVVGRNILSSFFAIERAHRVPARAPPPGAPPRPILMKLLNFRDRDAILRAAREKGDFTIQGHKVSLYPDFSNEIQKRRMQFLDVKKRLRNVGVPYAMQYPAKLRVVALGSTHFFDSPVEAVKWLDVNERSLRCSDHPT